MAAHTMARNGLTLAYETAGTGSTAMVFIHGWCCDRSYFAPQFKYFSTTRTVACLDLRGHGDSDRPEPGPGVYSVETLADDVLAVIDHSRLTRPVLVGHSLGALVALACASRGEDVAAVVMVDPAPITNERVKQYFRDSVQVCAADVDGSWRTGFAENLFMSSDVVRRAEIVTAMAAGPPEIAAAVLHAMADFDGATALSSVDLPVGSIGSAGPSNRTADLVRLCPAITIGQTLGAGHFNHLEVPEQVNPMIERFLTLHRL